MPVTSNTIQRFAIEIGWVPPAVNAPVVAGPYVPKMPDRLLIVTAIPGMGYLFDGAADQTGFQARVRGRGSADDMESYPDAESLAFLLDRLVFEASFPVVIGSVVISDAWRAGGQPAPMSSNPDDADRYEFTCNYAIVTGEMNGLRD
jgi:hypothetical protein